MTSLCGRVCLAMASAFVVSLTFYAATPAFSVTNSVGDDSTHSLEARIQSLSTQLQSPVTRLSKEQRQELQLLLDGALAITRRATIAAGPGSCYNEAYRHLSRDEALQLCEGDGDFETAQCFLQAKGSLSNEQAIRLCKDRGTPRAVICYQRAHRYLSGEKSVSLCESRGTEETAACFSEAYRKVNVDQALKLCKHGGSMERLVCLENAWRQFARCEDAIDQCRSY